MVLTTSMAVKVTGHSVDSPTKLKQATEDDRWVVTRSPDPLPPNIRLTQAL